MKPRLKMLPKFEKLYKMDSKRKIREWLIQLGSDAGGQYYEQTHGVTGGAMQTTRTYVLTGKNKGRSNETTPGEQRDLEAESLWVKKQQRGGYQTEIPESTPNMPMLAKKYDENKHNIQYPAFAQPKLDGIRCVVEVDENGDARFFSRTNKEFRTLEHIEKYIKSNTKIRSITLDGELYNHDLKDDFQSIVSAVKRDEACDFTKNIQLHVYDIFSDEDYQSRLQKIQNTLSKSGDDSCIKPVETIEVEDEEGFLALYQSFIENGYEGAMIRNKTGGYEKNKRSSNLQKFKSFEDDEFKITGAYENKGKMVGQCTFECVTKNGDSFGVKPKGDEQKRQKYWQDFQDGKLTGKMLTVRYFGYTIGENPVPRFPVGISIRDYE